MKEIATKRLLMSKVEISDADGLFRVWSNPKVTEYMNIFPMESKRQALEMIRFFQQSDTQGTACRFSISLIEDHSEIIGSCGFNYLDFENERAEIGYELDDQHWRKGYMTEALKALIDYGFKNHQLNRIEAKVMDENVSSLRLLKNIGFSKEGILRSYEKKGKQYNDIVMLSLLNSKRLDSH